jgi:SAM-dependent methyltransferase
MRRFVPRDTFQRVVDDHVVSNRANWDADAQNWIAPGRERWEDPRIRWGTWDVPEEELRLLPELDGLDVVELGCGTAYLSSWVAQRGARPVGLDNSSRQLASAKAFQREFDVPFPLVHGDAERAPFQDASFDLALSEYGAIIWCDPYRWIPEAARILRPGGHLVCLGNSYLLMLTFPQHGRSAAESLQRPHFGMHTFVDANNVKASVEFHIPHGDMIRLLRRSGFEIEDLIEIGAPATASDASHRMATVEWARRWPNEQAWVVRKGSRRSVR